MFKNLNDALNWLYVQKKSKRREDLTRIKNCVDLLNLSPSYKVIHIAGTNGKGSTASFIKKLLQLKGFNVGFFTSPFVVKFNERIQINDEYISDEEIVNYINKLYYFAHNYQEKYLDTIPFFELTFLMSLMYFKDNNVDYLVLECGLGGRLDATNIFNSIVSIITNVGFDHMNQLGNTLESIAWHKLGIVRKDHECFTCVNGKVKDYFLSYANEYELHINYVYDDVTNIVSYEDYIQFEYKGSKYKTTMNAKYQAYNASLAIAVIKELFPNYEDELINKALCLTTWPGRFEEIIPNVIIDGAHNIHGIEALVESLKNKYQDTKFKVVFTALHDKQIAEMLKSLDEIAYFYYFTTIVDSRATEVNYFKELTSKEYVLIDDYREAINKALEDKQADEILVITGSLHFISEVRKLFV